MSASETHSQANPSFKNKPPLRPTTASDIMERHHEDLVNMSSISDSKQPRRKRYVSSVSDVFSRYIWLRTIIDKRPRTIVQKLEEKKNLEFSPPRTLQSDQGPEFLGTVEELCKCLSIRVLSGQPHHPQSRGKVERSHGTWRKRSEHKP